MDYLPTPPPTAAQTAAAGADYDQDFYGVFIHELNETLNAPRLNYPGRQFPSGQVPLMFWTDHDCYLLMELARTSPDMIENLPRLKVASDPASTDFFYERLRTIAHAAKLEATACGGNYAVIRNFAEDIAHKVPMPWHAPGWEMHCKSTAESFRNSIGLQGPSKTPWSFQQQRLRPQYCNNIPFVYKDQLCTNGSSFNESRLEKSGLSEEFLKSQDEFFMGPTRTESLPASNSAWTSRTDSLAASSAWTSRCDSLPASSSAWTPRTDSLPAASSAWISRTEPLPASAWISRSESLPTTSSGSAWIASQKSEVSRPQNTAMWNTVESDFGNSTQGPRCGRYWPRQFVTKDSNQFESSAPKMGQQFPAYVRGAGNSKMGKNYYCKVHHNNSSEGSESSSPPSTPKESYLCVFCKGNNEPEAIYKSHPLRLNNIVICPSLRNYTCCICKATGDNAHTIKYCPYNKRGYFATRSHEKCNSNNNSRLKMKVQIIDESTTSTSSSSSGPSSSRRHDDHHHQHQAIANRSYNEDDDDNDADPEDNDEDYDDSSSSPMKLIISVEKQTGGSCKYNRN